MRMLFVVTVLVVYIGLPLHAAMTNPLVANWSQFAAEFLTVAFVLAVYTTAFTVAAVVLDRCLSGKWVWEDTVLVRRRSSTAEASSAIEERIAAEEAMLAANQEKLKEELNRQFIVWLSHK